MNEINFPSRQVQTSRWTTDLPDPVFDCIRSFLKPGEDSFVCKSWNRDTRQLHLYELRNVKTTLVAGRFLTQLDKNGSLAEAMTQCSNAVDFHLCKTNDYVLKRYLYKSAQNDVFIALDQISVKEWEAVMKVLPKTLKKLSINLDCCNKLTELKLPELPVLEELTIFAEGVALKKVGFPKLPALKKLNLVPCKAIEKLEFGAHPKMEHIHMNAFLPLQKGNFKALPSSCILETRDKEYYSYMLQGYSEHPDFHHPLSIGVRLANSKTLTGFIELKRNVLLENDGKTLRYTLII